MGNPNFRSFCTTYVKALCVTSTLDIAKLGIEAVTSPRLREPLFCYAYAIGRTGRLMRTVRVLDIKLYEEYSEIITQSGSFENFLAELAQVYNRGYFTKDISYNGPVWLPKEYVKVYMAWKAHCNARNNTIRQKKEMREYVLSNMKKYPELTPSKIAVAVGLDKRNLYAFINGNNNKLSVESADAVFDYVVSYLENAK